MNVTPQQYRRMANAILAMNIEEGAPVLAVEEAMDVWLPAFIDMLPEGTNPGNLNSNGPVFFGLAEELELELARMVGAIPAGMDDDVAKGRLDGAEINRTALQLFVIMGVALTAMDGPPIAKLLENFSRLDLDGKLRELLEGDGNER